MAILKNRNIKKVYTLILALILFTALKINAQTDHLLLNRPIEDGNPTKVNVSFYVIDIAEIDNKNQSFTIDVVVRLRWKDSRLSDVTMPLPINSIWQPNVQIYNLRDADKLLPDITTVLGDGTVQYIQRYYATLSSPLNFRDFPFDVQTLPITLLSFGYTPNEVELVFENGGSEKNYSISDWKVQPVGATSSAYKADLFDDSSEQITRPRMDYELKASRYIQFYWWKVLAPLMVILFLSWAVFWIDPSQVGAQIGVSGTSILTLIAFLYKLDNVLPPVSYLTHMDHFIFTALLLVFLAYIEAIVSITYAHKNKKEIALKLDYSFRIAYPVVFLFVIYFFWF